MTDVRTVTTPLEDYTWANANFALSSITASIKKWQSASIDALDVWAREQLFSEDALPVTPAVDYRFDAGYLPDTPSILANNGNAVVDPIEGGLVLERPVTQLIDNLPVDNNNMGVFTAGNVSSFELVPGGPHTGTAVKHTALGTDAHTHAHSASGHTYGVATGKASITGGNKVTFSIDCKGEVGGEEIQLFIFLYDTTDGGYRAAPSQTFNATNEWKRYSFTVTSDVSDIKAWFRVDNNTSGNVVYWDAPLLEEADYPGQFTATSRSQTNVYLDPTFIQAKGTIALSYTPLSTDTYGNYPTVITANWWSSPVTEDWIGIYRGSGWSAGDQMTFAIHDVSNAAVIASATVFGINSRIGHELILGIGWDTVAQEVMFYCYDKTTNETLGAWHFTGKTQLDGWSGFTEINVGTQANAGSYSPNAKYNRISFFNELLTPAQMAEFDAAGSAPVKDITLPKAESFAIAEQYADVINYVRNFAESINFVETYTDFINFMINIVESFTMSDSIAKTIDMGAFMETLAFSESVAKDFELNQSEAFSVAEAEAHTVQFSRNFNEALGVVDEISKHSVKKLAEAFGMTDDDPVKTIGKNISENFAFAEVLTRTVAFVRAYNEGIGISDAISKAVGLNKEEAFAILEEYRRNANAVMSDIRLGNGLDLTETEFVELITRASATGYSDFARLMMGDYEYQDAIIKVAMSSINSDRPSVRRLQAEVDLPDIVDRGSATVPVNGTTISFNRTYNDPPEVSVSIKSGTVIARPQVTSITATGFTVELFDASDTSVSGTITWSSIGY